MARYCRNTKDCSWPRCNCIEDLSEVNAEGQVVAVESGLTTREHGKVAAPAPSAPYTALRERLEKEAAIWSGQWKDDESPDTYT